jgi:plastocyanin
MKRLLVLLCLAASLMPLPSRAAALPGPQTLQVSMKEFKFSPATMDVNVGDTVKWTYDETSADLMPNCESIYFQLPLPVNCPGHSTTSVDSAGKTVWDSGVHRADGFPYSRAFDTPGTYHYICTIHGGANKNNPVTAMEGDIVVHGAIVVGFRTKVLGVKFTRPLPATGVPFPVLPGLGMIALGFRLRRLASR